MLYLVDSNCTLQKFGVKKELFVGMKNVKTMFLAGGAL
jgi:hypothetical protein